MLACLTGDEAEDHASATAEASATDGADAAAPASCALVVSPGQPGQAASRAQRGGGHEGEVPATEVPAAAADSDDAAPRAGAADGGEDAPRCPYALLGLERSASEGAVRAAYRRRALRLHPDRFPNATQAEREAATRRFQALAGAYETLSDPALRAEYDAASAEGGTWRHAVPDWDAAVSTFAQAMDVAGASLAGLHQAAGGDLATHAIGRVVTSGGVAVAGAVARTELQASP